MRPCVTRTWPTSGATTQSISRTTHLATLHDGRCTCHALRHPDPSEPLDPDAVEAHADLAANFIIRAIEIRRSESV